MIANAHLPGSAHRLVSACGLALLLAWPATAQAPVAALAAPAPALDLQPATDLPRPQEAAKGGTWKSSLNLGASYASGNTSLRTANLAADAKRRQGLHATTLTASWNYSEQKDDTTKQWSLDQRRTTGGARHQKYFTEAERTFVFAAVDAENNYNQNVDLRLTGTVGLGNQLIKRDDLKFAIELGAGYFTEASRTSGVKDTDFVTGRAGWDLDWKINGKLQFLNALKFFFSLEDDREMYGEVDSKLRATLNEGMFAQAQWVVQWDNTPGRDANGLRGHSVDHMVLLSVGWAF